MHRTESLQSLAKIFILAFLCSEMHSSFTQSNAAEHPFNNYPSSINGSETLLEHARHQASIRLAIQDYIFGEGHICGGAIIAPSVVLIVAQCVHNYQTQTARHPAELKVVMGTLNRYQRDEHTLVYGVTHVHQPKTFNARTLRDNIAIIMLERDIPPAHPTVQPASLSWKTFRSGEVGENLSDAMKQQTYEVTSWFATEKQIPYTQLMSLNATQLSDAPCVAKFGSLYGPDMVCMGYQHPLQEAACEQDAGAPLVHNNQLLALTSIQSVDCKQSLQPTAFVDVAHHSKWISEQIGDGTNCNSSIWGTLAFLIFTIWTARRTKWVKFLP
ncbi:vitellin-degrading protease [Anastrepha ludens]|uniref:vitellin-degrading protease n=1 Tax=Anastrepha ludens TaxID=28586 RepID=UPI0023B0DE9D|nr:vitellin-degrading protease [Anastrepha ludens]